MVFTWLLTWWIKRWSPLAHMLPISRKFQQNPCAWISRKGCWRKRLFFYQVRLQLLSSIDPHCCLGGWGGGGGRGCWVYRVRNGRWRDREDGSLGWVSMRGPPVTSLLAWKISSALMWPWMVGGGSRMHEELDPRVAHTLLFNCWYCSVCLKIKKLIASSECRAGGGPHRPDTIPL